MGTVMIGSDTFDVYGTTAGLTSHANGSAAFYATFAAATTAARDRTHVECSRLIAAMPFDEEANAAPATATGAVVTACYELTLAALADPAILTATTTGSNVRRAGAKGTEVEFFGPTRGGRFPARVMSYLTPLLATPSSSTSLSGGAYASAVVDEDSAFADDAVYTLTL